MGSRDCAETMTREEAENGRDEMEIDGCEQREAIAIPEGFNPNYLKVFYGKQHIRFITLFNFIEYLLITI